MDNTTEETRANGEGSGTLQVRVPETCYVCGSGLIVIQDGHGGAYFGCANGCSRRVTEETPGLSEAQRVRTDPEGYGVWRWPGEPRTYHVPVSIEAAIAVEARKPLVEALEPVAYEFSKEDWYALAWIARCDDRQPMTLEMPVASWEALLELCERRITSFYAPQPVEPASHAMALVQRIRRALAAPLTGGND